MTTGAFEARCGVRCEVSSGAGENFGGGVLLPLDCEPVVLPVDCEPRGATICPPPPPLPAPVPLPVPLPLPLPPEPPLGGPALGGPWPPPACVGVGDCERARDALFDRREGGALVVVPRSPFCAMYALV